MSHITKFRDLCCAPGWVGGDFTNESFVMLSLAQVSSLSGEVCWPTSDYAYQAAHFFETDPEVWPRLYANCAFGSCDAPASRNSTPRLY